MPRTRFECARSWFVARCSIQLSQRGERNIVVRAAGLKSPAFGVGGKRFIRLSSARVFGSSGWDRTSDDWLMRPGLLPLSYGTIVSWQTVMDSNHRMPQSKCGALPAWRTAYEIVAEDEGFEPSSRCRPHLSRVLHYHSGNLPIVPGYEFRGCPIFAPGFPQPRHFTAAATPAICTSPEMRLIWLQRRNLNSRSLAYETNGDGRSPTLQCLESVRGFEPLSTRMKTWCPKPLDDTDKTGAHGRDLNGRPIAYKAIALPTELRGLLRFQFGCVCT